MKPIVKRYPKDDVTVVWQPAICVHSGICFAGLPAVFDPRRRPWIEPGAATKEAIVAQVGRCPSGALSIESKPPAPPEPGPDGTPAPNDPPE